MRRLALALLLILAASTEAHAQARQMPANDSLFRRARRLVAEGNGIAGRALVDTLLGRASEGTTAYGDALYWRGALAETAADAERDYRRVIVEYAISAYADDALLAIAELEQARGDRAGALQHLQRFVREHPVSPARGRAALSAARLAFDQRDTRLGCAMVLEARASVTAGDVELMNQLEYFNNRCPNETPPVPVSPAPILPAPTTSVTVTPAPTVSTREAPAKPAPRQVAKRAPEPEKTVEPPVEKLIDKAPATSPTKSAPTSAPTSAAKAAAKPASKAVASPVGETAADKPVAGAPEARAGNYTIQLAAYNTMADAERLVKKLASNGVKARISGTAKPFRVRLGFYATKQAAVDEVASLKARRIIGFVTTEAPTKERATP